jgi:hypothetical protein
MDGLLDHAVHRPLASLLVKLLLRLPVSPNMVTLETVPDHRES